MQRRGAILMALTLLAGGGFAAATASSAAPPITIPVPGFTACPPHQLVWESNGHDYVAAPDPTGTSCYTPVELPITVPPTLN